MSRSGRPEAPSRVSSPSQRARLEVVRPPAEASDGDLVEGARAGEGWAREMLYRRHVAMVASTARRLLRQASDAEDVVQETFLLAFEHLHQLHDPAALRGWLARIAVSRAHRRFRWRRLKTYFGGDSGEWDTLASEASKSATPEQRAELSLIDRALETLPLKLRGPWVLHYVVGHSLEDTATAFGCSVATAKRRIAAAEQVVQRHIQEVPHG